MQSAPLDQEAFESQQQWIYASRWKRLPACIIDLFLIWVTLSFMQVLWLRVLDPFKFFILFWGWYFIYYFISELFTHTTLGKRIFKIRVINNRNGEDAGFVPIFFRTLTRLLLIEGLSLLFSYEALHDNWSGTAVVRMRKQ